MEEDRCEAASNRLRVSTEFIETSTMYKAARKAADNYILVHSRVDGMVAYESVTMLVNQMDERCVVAGVKVRTRYSEKEPKLLA